MKLKRGIWSSIVKLNEIKRKHRKKIIPRPTYHNNLDKMLKELYKAKNNL